ncbi:two-component regulator propeller domain-containing protein [Xanthomarina sp. GH4-25]|uniref:two-component regulator propeller domain-containing protein n=1 Tax=Xanthomarina sp. GH4-25 TaxID=3349335 RepID=UPI00387792E7
MNYFRILFICCFSCVAFAQSNKQVAFRELTVAQGLSQNSVVSIAQDSLGFMWFATQDGLNKYDGREFTHYNIQFEDVTRPTFSKLGKIYTDKSGTLWIISNSGILQKYDITSDSFKVFNTFKNSSIVFQNKNLDYFIGTYGSGLFKIDNQSKDTIQLLQTKDKTIDTYDIIQYGEHQLAATSKGVLTIEGDAYNFKQIPGFEDTNFSSLALSIDETLYLGSFSDGLFVKHKTDDAFKQFKGFSTDVLPTNLMIQDVLVDKYQKLWLATYGQGLFIIDFEQETIQHFLANKNDPYALHYNDVLCLFKDFTGTIWLGTDGAGLSYFDEYLVKFNVLTNNQMPKDIHVDVIRAIAVNDDDIWLGTSGKGLTKINTNNQEPITFTTDNSNLSGNRIMSLLYYNKDLWIGHQTHGLQKVTQTGDMVSFSEIASFTIWKIYEASEGKLWLCTRNNGLILFDPEKGIIKQFNQENSNLTSNNIRTIEKGGLNTFWIGTEDAGVFRLDTNTNSIEDIKIVLNPIKSLYFNKDILWIGTNGNGLIKYQISTKKVTTYTKEQGLPNNVIYGILPDNQGDLWLSSNKGISKFHIENQDVTLENYSNYDGLQAFEFNTGAYFKDANGTLYFGGLEGLNWFNPNQLEFNPTKPKTVITNFEVYNKKRKLEDHLKLKYNENTITFTFSSLHFSQPERNQYQYRLINNDEQWISSGNNNKAHYTNLPPNNYQFQVISSNYDGVWNTNPDTYSFTILEPWYANTLAKITYLLLFIIFILSLYNYLKWRWHIKNQLRLEHEETARLKKLDELKTKLYTNISHEFRTPLTLISGPIDNQLAKPELSKSDKKELSLIKQNADRLLKLVNQMLDLSMLDSGQIKLKVSQGNLGVLLKQIVSAFQYKANKNETEIKSKIQNLDLVWYDKDIIEKVISNILSNAVKYAPKESVIQFEANKQEGMLVVSIINETQHVSKTDLSKLFQRFYQDNTLSEGVGVGLALVRDLVTLSKGTIIANNIDDNKIQFTISLPVNKTAFNETELILNTEEPNSPEFSDNNKNINTDKPTVLIVEDETDIRTFIVSTFKTDYQIIEAANGKIGEEKAQKNLPDIIISDIMMPVQDGIALCHAIKTNELTSHIPVILLTAKVGEENEIEGLKIGADAYVTKPFNSKKLKIRVKKLIESRQQLQKHFSKTLSINPELAITSTEAEFLKRMQLVLDKHITNSEFTSDAFSKYMHVSRTQLHRKLKAITGMTTSEFIRSQRLKLAVELLKKSDATVSEIAYQVGFNTPSYFIKCFKDTYNTTPSEYISNS